MNYRLLKILLATLLVLAVLVVSVALLVRYLFPSEVVREELETALSKRLGGTVSIKSLEFDMLTGLRAQQVVLVKRGSRLAYLDVVRLRYASLLPRGSTRPSRDATGRFRNEPS